MSNTVVTLRFWHGGKFKKDGRGFQYVGGKIKTFPVDADELCWWYLLELAQKCGYKTIDSILYSVPDLNLDSSLRQVYNDTEVLEMGALALKFRTIDLYVVDEVNVPNLVKTPQPTITNPSFVAKKATQPKEASLPKNITQPKKPTPLWKSPIKKVQNNPPLAQIPSPVTTKSHPSNIKHNDILPIQSQTKSTNQTHLDDYHTWYDDRPESPIPLKDLIGENEGDLSQDRTNPLYESESEEYDGSESEPDDDVDEIYIEQEELEEIDDEDLIVEEGDSSDDELKDARENVRGYNAKLFELAQQLQREIAAGKVGSNEQVPTPKSVNDLPEMNVSEYEDSDDEILTPGESEEEDF